MTRQRKSLGSAGWAVLLGGLMIAIAGLSLWGVDLRSDKERAMAALGTIHENIDVVFVPIDGDDLPQGTYLPGPIAPPAQLRGFRRVAAIVPSGSPLPEGANLESYGSVVLAVWRPEPWHLIAEGIDVFPLGSAAIIRGENRLVCRTSGDEFVPFACHRAGGHTPIRHLDATAVTAPKTGYVEFKGRHPSTAQQLTIDAITPPPFRAEVISGLGIPQQIAVRDRLDVQVNPGGDFVIRIEAGQGGRARFRWWSPSAFPGATETACIRVARQHVRDGNANRALAALRRGANGLPCRLRASAKTDR